MELSYFLIGMAGAAFLLYAFTLMRLLTRTARLLLASLLMLMIVLLGSRLLFPGAGRNTSNFLPSGSLPWNRPEQLAELVRPGWVEVPFIILEQMLSDANTLNQGGTPSPVPSPAPASPRLPNQAELPPSPTLPLPTISPTISPTLPQPSPTQPSPTQPPFQSPSPQLPPRQEQYPEQYPDQYPDNPYPAEPFPNPAQPPTDSFEADPAQPSPIPAWW